MKYKWIEDIDEFMDIRKEWDSALLLSKEDNPFLLSDFISSWWKYYHNGMRLRVFVARKENKIVAGIPLCLKGNGRLRYPGGIAANYTEFLNAGADPIFLWQSFFEALCERKDWQSLCLERYRENKLDPAALKSLFSYRKEVLFDICESDHAYLADIPENFEGYIGCLPKTLRYYIKRSEKEFSKLGDISVYSLKGYDEMIDSVDTYIKFSRDSFKKRNRESAFEDETNCLFLKDLTKKLYQAGYLDVNLLKLDERVIAINIGFSIGNNLNYIYPAFDVNFASLNPGHLLIYKLIELGSKRKNDIFDMYTGYRFYKEQWCSRKDKIVGVDIRRRTIRNILKRAVITKTRNSHVIAKLKKIVRSSPALMKIVKNKKCH